MYWVVKQTVSWDRYLAFSLRVRLTTGRDRIEIQCKPAGSPQPNKQTLAIWLNLCEHPIRHLVHRRHSGRNCYYSIQLCRRDGIIPLGLCFNLDKAHILVAWMQASKVRLS
jgi:hypothetical protein